MRSASDPSSTPVTATRMGRSLQQSGASASGEKVSGLIFSEEAQRAESILGQSSKRVK